MATRKSTKAKPKTTAKKSSSGMSDSQKAIHAKLKRKGMSDAQAAAFSKNAHNRKSSAKKTTTKKPKASRGKR
jgi:hypothetical protein